MDGFQGTFRLHYFTFYMNFMMLSLGLLISVMSAEATAGFRCALSEVNTHYGMVTGLKRSVNLLAQ